MKQLLFVMSLVFCIALSVSGCAKKEPVTEAQSTGITKEEMQEIRKTQMEIQNVQTDIKNTLTDIQNTQRAIFIKLSELEKKSAAPSPAAQRGRPAVDFNKVYKLPVTHSPIRGAKNAPVTIVEFSDFQCPYCANLQPTLHDVLKAYPKEVRLVFKQYPLPFHHQAMNAAKAAEAAKEQGKFWEMHDLIFQNFNKLSEQIFKDFAQQLGLNMEKFSADFASGKYDQQIRQDMALARSSDVRGTPTLFINGKRMQAREFNDFKRTIDSILKK